MKGTILDFLNFATEKPDLAKELVELASKHDFEFSDEVPDEQLKGVSGGLIDTTPGPLGDTSQSSFDDAMNKQQQIMQLMSNIQKGLLSTASSIVDNAK